MAGAAAGTFSVTLWLGPKPADPVIEATFSGNDWKGIEAATTDAFTYPENGDVRETLSPNEFGLDANTVKSITKRPGTNDASLDAVGSYIMGVRGLNTGLSPSGDRFGEDTISPTKSTESNAAYRLLCLAADALFAATMPANKSHEKDVTNYAITAAAGDSTEEMMSVFFVDDDDEDSGGLYLKEKLLEKHHTAARADFSGCYVSTPAITNRDVNKLCTAIGDEDVVGAKLVTIRPVDGEDEVEARFLSPTKLFVRTTLRDRRNIKSSSTGPILVPSRLFRKAAKNVYVKNQNHRRFSERRAYAVLFSPAAVRDSPRVGLWPGAPFFIASAMQWWRMRGELWNPNFDREVDREYAKAVMVGMSNVLGPQYELADTTDDGAMLPLYLKWMLVNEAKHVDEPTEACVWETDARAFVHRAMGFRPIACNGETWDYDAVGCRWTRIGKRVDNGSVPAESPSVHTAAAIALRWFIRGVYKKSDFYKASLAVRCPKPKKPKNPKKPKKSMSARCTRFYKWRDQAAKECASPEFPQKKGTRPLGFSFKMLMMRFTSLAVAFDRSSVPANVPRSVQYLASAGWRRAANVEGSATLKKIVRIGIRKKEDALKKWTGKCMAAIVAVCKAAKVPVFRKPFKWKEDPKPGMPEVRFMLSASAAVNLIAAVKLNSAATSAVCSVNLGGNTVWFRLHPNENGFVSVRSMANEDGNYLAEPMTTTAKTMLSAAYKCLVNEGEEGAKHPLSNVLITDKLGFYMENDDGGHNLPAWASMCVGAMWAPVSLGYQNAKGDTEKTIVTEMYVVRGLEPKRNWEMMCVLEDQRGDRVEMLYDELVGEVRDSVADGVTATRAFYHYVSHLLSYFKQASADDAAPSLRFVRLFVPCGETEQEVAAMALQIMGAFVGLESVAADVTTEIPVPDDLSGSERGMYAKRAKEVAEGVERSLREGPAAFVAGEDMSSTELRFYEDALRRDSAATEIRRCRSVGKCAAPRMRRSNGTLPSLCIYPELEPLQSDAMFSYVAPLTHVQVVLVPGGEEDLPGIPTDVPAPEGGDTDDDPIAQLYRHAGLPKWTVDGLATRIIAAGDEAADTGGAAAHVPDAGGSANTKIEDVEADSDELYGVSANHLLEEMILEKTLGTRARLRRLRQRVLHRHTVLSKESSETTVDAADELSDDETESDSEDDGETETAQADNWEKKSKYESNFEAYEVVTDSDDDEAESGSASDDEDTEGTSSEDDDPHSGDRPKPVSASDDAKAKGTLSPAEQQLEQANADFNEVFDDDGDADDEDDDGDADDDDDDGE